MGNTLNTNVLGIVHRLIDCIFIVIIVDQKRKRLSGSQYKKKRLRKEEEERKLSNVMKDFLVKTSCVDEPSTSTSSSTELLEVVEDAQEITTEDGPSKYNKRRMIILVAVSRHLTKFLLILHYGIFPVCHLEVDKYWWKKVHIKLRYSIFQ